MVVDEGNQNPTNIQSRSGDGIQKANGHGNRVPRDQRTAIRWSFANDHAERRNVVTRQAGHQHPSYKILGDIRALLIIVFAVVVVFVFERLFGLL